MISSAADLKKAILALESKKMMQEEELKILLGTTYQSLKPVNLLRNAWSKITGDSFSHNPLLNAVVGAGAVFVTRNILINRITGLVSRKLAGGIIERGVIKTALTGVQLLKTSGFRILSYLLKKKK